MELESLPFEIIEIILKNLHTTPFARSADLAGCSLVCRSWQALAQSLYFSEIVYGTKEELSPAFTNNVDLQSYVRVLWIQSLNIQQTEAIANICPNLKQLVVCRPDGRIIRIPQDLMKALHTCIRSNSLTSLCLAHIRDLPLRLFYLCSALTELRIQDCNFAPTHTDAVQKQSPRPQLRSLYIDPGATDILAWLLTEQGAFDLSKLKTFHCLEDIDNNNSFSQMIQLTRVVSPSLDDLCLSLPESCGSVPFTPTPDIMLCAQNLTNLRKIRLYILFQQADDRIDEGSCDHVPWLISFFSNYPDNHSLEEILIPCMFLDQPESDWKGLDTVLTSPKFRSLTVVKLAIHDYGHEEQTILDSSRIHLIQELRRLHEKGILEVTFSRREGFVSDDDDWWMRLVDECEEIYRSPSPSSDSSSDTSFIISPIPSIIHLS